MQKDEVERAADGKRQTRRITVDLEGQAAEEFDKLIQSRGLSVSRAVRQGLSLLARADPKRYQLILRDKTGREDDRELILV